MLGVQSGMTLPQPEVEELAILYIGGGEKVGL
jgi:hypothetical protein